MLQPVSSQTGARLLVRCLEAQGVPFYAVNPFSESTK